MVRPRFGDMSLEEAQALLQGLHAENRVQLRHGVPGIWGALRSGSIRYDRSDPDEHWQSLRELWRSRRGDCEDLSAAVSAELEELLGIPARPILRRVKPGLIHAQVLILPTMEILDPSVIGGMGRV